jgi:hypothetical protein
MDLKTSADPRTLWVPKTPSASRDLGVLVDQPAETIDP